MQKGQCCYIYSTHRLNEAGTEVADVVYELVVDSNTLPCSGDDVRLVSHVLALMAAVT